MSPREHDEHEEAVLHRLMESLGEASGVLHDIDGKLEWTEALRKYLVLQEKRWRRFVERSKRIVLGVIVGFVISLVVLADAQRRAGTAATTAKSAAAKVKTLGLRNRLGIRVSCTLLAQAIADSSSTTGKPRTKAIRYSRERTALLIAALSRSLTPAERERYRVLSERIEKAGGAVPVPPCDEVALHPERYREVVR